MKKLINGTANEFYKLAIRKKYIVFLIIAIALSFVRVAASFISAKLSGGNVALSLGNIPMTMIGFFTEILVPLIVFMAVTDLITTELGDGTFKAVLLLPQSRMKVITTKIFAAFLMGAAYYIILLIACLIIQGVFAGASGETVKTILAYLIDLVPMFVLVLMAAVINLMSKGSTLAMFLCILVYAVMKYLVTFVPGMNGVLFVSYMQWHKLWIGSTLPIRALLPKIGVVVGSGVLLYSAAFVLIDRREL